MCGILFYQSGAYGYTVRGSNSAIVTFAYLLNKSTHNPIALRVAKTLWSFGHSECKRVKGEKGEIGLVGGKLNLLRIDPFSEGRHLLALYQAPCIKFVFYYIMWQTKITLLIRRSLTF